jgi:hypothetical protein
MNFYGQDPIVRKTVLNKHNRSGSQTNFDAERVQECTEKMEAQVEEMRALFEKIKNMHVLQLGSIENIVGKLDRILEPFAQLERNVEVRLEKLERNHPRECTQSDFEFENS